MHREDFFRLLNLLMIDPRSDEFNDSVTSSGLPGKAVKSVMQYRLSLNRVEELIRQYFGTCIVNSSLSRAAGVTSYSGEISSNYSFQGLVGVSVKQGKDEEIQYSLTRSARWFPTRCDISIPTTRTDDLDELIQSLEFWHNHDICAPKAAEYLEIFPSLRAISSSPYIHAGVLKYAGSDFDVKVTLSQDEFVIGIVQASTPGYDN